MPSLAARWGSVFRTDRLNARMPKVRGCIKSDIGAVALADYELGDPGPGQALVRPTLTTICGSDIHIIEDIPEVPAGMPMGHECVGIVEAVGDGVERIAPGDKVVVCCLQSCGHCDPCTHDEMNLCATLGAPMNLVLGAQAEAVLVNGADFSVSPLPPSVDEKAGVLVADVLSTGFGAVERGGVRAGSSVAVFAQGPVGLCATIAAKHYGAERIVAVESIPERVALARRFGATDVVAPETAVEEIRELTGGAGVDVAVEALGKQITFENCCHVARLGGTISSVGVYGGVDRLSLPTDGSFIHRHLVTTFCPAGRARLEYLLGLIDSGAIDPTPMFTHEMALDDIVAAYELFRGRREGVVKIAVH
jgi:threonine dehydrogenase-like Zn-dependent dehydrogenase